MVKKKKGKEAELYNTNQGFDSKETLDPKAKARKEAILEVVVAILLGVTVSLTAWATWISALHTGNQETHFTESNNLASSGTALYNEASEMLMQEIMVWNSIQNYVLDADLAMKEGESRKVKVIEDKVKALRENCSDEFADAVRWALKNDKSPFEKKGYIKNYYKEAKEYLKKSQDLLEEGKTDNKNGDAFGLVSVIFSIVLFLLGMVGLFKRLPNRMFVLGVAVVFLIFGFIFMLTIPMPTGFSFSKYLGNLFT